MKASAALLAALLAPLSLSGCLSGGGDDDGLDPRVEAAGWTVLTLGLDCAEGRRHVTSDPDLSDTDGDGWSDFMELQATTDPRNADTDGDGIKDGPTLTLQASDPRVDAWRKAGLHESPPLTFFGEAGFPMTGRSGIENIRTDPRKADSDSCGGIGDEIGDADEVRGWTVTIGGIERHVTSDPSAPDSDRDGLHDGLEARWRSDPRAPDTDGDGVDDLNDAFPLCDAAVTVQVLRFNLKVNKDAQRLPAGGADLLIDLRSEQGTGRWGPVQVPSGESRPAGTSDFNIPDGGSTLPAPGRWEKPVLLTFWDQDAAPDTDDPINVRSGASGNLAEVVFNATAAGGTGELRPSVLDGPDARVELSFRTFCL